MRSTNKTAMKTGSILLAVLLMLTCLLAGCGGQAAVEPLPQEDRVLRHEDVAGGSEFVFGTDIYKSTVVSVEFHDNIPRSAKNAVDVSETQNGGVLLWAKEGKDGLNQIHIGAQGGVIAPRDCGYLFSSSEDLVKLGKFYRNLKTVTFGSAFDGSQAVNLSHMFDSCNVLETLDLTGFTGAAAEDLSYMFADCKALTEAAMTDFSSASVKDMNNMFRYCVNLQSVSLGGMETSQVTDLGEMFSFCYNLTQLDLTGMNTAAAESMDKMFFQCKNLKTLDVTSFDTSAVKDMSNMFASCKSLEKLDLSGFQLAEKVKLKDIFNHCSAGMELITENEKLQSLFSMQSE